MIRVSEIAEHWWLGLCPKAPVVCASQADMDDPTEPIHAGSPDGGTGGLGSIRRGVGAARSGMKTLLHNPQLFWFPLLAGLVLAGLSIILGAISTVFSSLGWQFFIDSYISPWRFFADPFITQWWPGFYPDSARLLYSLGLTFGLTFGVELLAAFCLVFLLAGLILSVSSQKDCTVSFFSGLTRAREYLGPLAAWSVVVAFAGTLLFVAGQYSYLLNVSLGGFVDNVLNQSPFNYVLSPNLFYTLFPYALPGESGIGFVSIYSGLGNTLILSAINVLLFALTLFVVPSLVLEGKSLKGAVYGSFTLTKKTPGEVAACVLGLGIVVFAASLAYLLFPVAAGGNIAVDYWPPPNVWLAAGILYVLALTGIALVAATVGGIATLNLYTYAKTGNMPGSAEKTRELI
ncbi:MAG: DUF6159 family protein [Methanoregulaceae archaeon]